MHPFLIFGLGLLLGSSASQEAERKATLRQQEMLKAALKEARLRRQREEELARLQERIARLEEEED